MRKYKIASYGRLWFLGAALATVISVGAPSARAAEPKKATAGLSDVERIVATEEVRQLKYRFWANVDSKKWNEVLALFESPDAKVEMLGLKKPDGTPITTAKQFVDFASGPYYSNGNRAAIHLGLNPIITIKSATEAEAIWTFEAVEYPVVDGKPGSADRHVWGQHTDRYIKTTSGWRIAFTRFGGGPMTFTEYAPVKPKRE